MDPGLGPCRLEPQWEHQWEHQWEPQWWEHRCLVAGLAARVLPARRLGHDRNAPPLHSPASGLA